MIVIVVKFKNKTWEDLDLNRIFITYFLSDL